jgi:hypothetical protein
MTRMTVLLATRLGRESLLPEALASVAAQTVPVRLIVACNGVRPDLPDGATAIHRESFADDGGEWSGRALLDAWGGDGYACFLHDDDVMMPTRCERMAELLDEGYDLAFSGMELFDGDYRAPHIQDARLWTLADFASVCGHTATPTAAFGPRLFDVEVPTGYRSGAADTLYWMRCLAAGLRVGFTPEVLYRYRLHAGPSGNASQPANFCRFGEAEFEKEVARIWAEGRSLEIHPTE